MEKEWWGDFHLEPGGKWNGYVAGMCVNKYWGMGGVGVLPDMGSMSLLITEIAGI
jgi:hypothetical protein